jgi:hypothetical protein
MNCRYDAICNTVSDDMATDEPLLLRAEAQCLSLVVRQETKTPTHRQWEKKNKTANLRAQ